MHLNRFALMSLSAALVMTACSSNESGEPGDFGVIQTPPVGISPLPDVVAAERRLREFETEQAFYEALREALIAQRNEDHYYVDVTPSSPPPEPVTAPIDAPAVGIPESPQGAPVADSAGNDGATDASTAPLDVTGTNVQEIGVDEADRVKTDGEYLYVLNRGYDSYGVPEPVPVGPPVEVPIDDGSTDLSARLSMPAPEPTSTLRILSLQPDAPDATPVANISVDFDGLSPSGMYLHKSSSSSSLVMTASGYGNYYSDWDDPYAFYGARSLLSRIDVTNPQLAAISHRIQVDGQIISSRRIGNQMFFASRHYPAIPGVDPYSVDYETWVNIVNSTDLSNVLPQYSQTGSNSSSSLVTPSECFVAQQADTLAYYSPDIISLVTVNIDTMQISDTACYLGSSEALYASPDSVFLATTRWDYQNGVATDDALASSDVAFVDPRLDTDIHKFAIGDGTLDYQGSGTVSGHLGWNNLRMPFRMSEYNGLLRVITHSATQSESVSPVNVSVLQPDAQGNLIRIAQLPNEAHPQMIGKPFEELYATKFLGNTAYLVTFRQTDPLYVVDLSTPTNPYIAGELEIDGFSEYLQPVGEGYLLGIGKDAVATQNGGGGLVQGVKLSLFDVTDASSPREVQSVVVGQRGTESGALSDHRGITVQMANENHPTRVAIGIDVAGQADAPAPTPQNASNWYPFNYTGLHGFEIRTGADAGIARMGAIQVNPDASNYGYYGSYEDRSVIVNDATYYINQSNVYSAHWSDLSNSVGPR